MNYEIKHKLDNFGWKKVSVTNCIYFCRSQQINVYKILNLPCGVLVVFCSLVRHRIRPIQAISLLVISLAHLCPLHPFEVWVGAWTLHISHILATARITSSIVLKRHVR